MRVGTQPERRRGGSFATGFLIAILTVLALPMVVRVMEGPPPEPGIELAEATEPVGECEIQGLAEYQTEEILEGACSAAVYIRSCREAQVRHRESCTEFCGSLQELGTRRSCTGTSRPVAQLFDPRLHCKKVRHEQFEVSCSVRAACACEVVGEPEPS